MQDSKAPGLLTTVGAFVRAPPEATPLRRPSGDLPAMFLPIKGPE
jgi:hypothetical protein